MNEFFDPIRRQELLSFLRAELDKLHMQIALLDEIRRSQGVDIDMSETFRVASVLEAKIASLEIPYMSVN